MLNAYIHKLCTIKHYTYSVNAIGMNAKATSTDSDVMLKVSGGDVYGNENGKVTVNSVITARGFYHDLKNVTINDEVVVDGINHIVASINRNGRNELTLTLKRNG